MVVPTATSADANRPSAIWAVAPVIREMSRFRPRTKGSQQPYLFRAAWGLFYDGAPGASPQSNTLENATLYSLTGEYKYSYFEEPLTFDHIEAIEQAADARN